MILYLNPQAVQQVSPTFVRLQGLPLLAPETEINKRIAYILYDILC